MLSSWARCTEQNESVAGRAAHPLFPRFKRKWKAMATIRSKSSPARKRAEFTASKITGKISGSALANLRTRFRGEKGLGEFYEWRTNPVTMLFADVLRELALTPPASCLSPDDMAVDYGVSSAFSFSAALVDDPSSVFPDVFAKATPGRGTGEQPMGYTQAPDEDE